MLLGELLTAVSSPAGRVIRICSDSREVQPGDCFAAIRGTSIDGHKYIAQALENGARYVVCEEVDPKSCADDRAEFILVGDSRRALALLAQAALGYPANELTNLAVTGTNGKTTVSWLVHSIITHAAQRCGLVGTILYDNGISRTNASLTTPDSTRIARLCRELVDSGGKYLMLEASSHALSQQRLAGICFAGAAFTNLSGDHLDYHLNEEDYLAAKAKLFENLLSHATAVLNRHSPAAEIIAQKTDARILWYGMEDSGADLTAKILHMDALGTHIEICFEQERIEIFSRLIGSYNVLNILAAAGLCLSADFELDAIATGVEKLTHVPGRLEPVENDKGITILIDYAHTDDALANVLGNLRPLSSGGLILVFGCGGDRDRSKRSRMAQVAQQYCDRVIVTSDNPRTEDPDQIIEDIIVGFDKSDTKHMVEPDRRRAIEVALKEAKKGDVVLIAGKGHETYQIIGDTRIDFEDAAIAREFLSQP